jgi:N-acetylglucosaminyl-diphospho-decaprenol L-rhamnosyltransferase
VISVSIVSHGHALMVRRLVETLLDFQRVGEVIVTFNIPEGIDIPLSDRVKVVLNHHPLGFATNHNNAFRISSGEVFCILNPDVLFSGDPFGTLEEIMRGYGGECIVAPLVKDESGAVADSFRYFPSAGGILAKVFLGKEGRYPMSGSLIRPDWVAGMFLLVHREVFADLGGFDPKYYLYYEDVDLCWRLRRRGGEVLLCPSVHVVHAAQRDSWCKPRYFLWHLASMFRFLAVRYGLKSQNARVTG